MRRTIVVGAGAAGAPMAARLSEDPDHEVILLEAGPADGHYPDDVRDASTLRGAMPGHPLNWGYQGELTPDLPYTIARGRIAGGSSTINGAYVVRPRPADFDRWARVGGAHWRYDAALPTLRAMETDHDFGADAIHGADGPLPVHRPVRHGPAASAFHAAATALGHPEEPDKNAPGGLGVGPVPANIVDGVRVNTGLAYLEPARARANLRIVGGVQVHRVLFQADRAIGVQTSAGAFCADEIVLCAGAIGSAHLLLVSGIGPADHLRARSIAVIADLPVGESFSDHPDIGVGWRAAWPLLDPSERCAFPVALNLDAGGDRGPGVSGDLELLLAVKPLAYLLTGSTNLWAGGARSAVRHPVRTARAMRGTSARRAAAQIAHGEDYQLLVGLQAPEGRGRLSLTAADPSHPPRIEYRYLESATDLARMRTGVRTAAEILEHAAFSGVSAGLTEIDRATLRDDTALNAWMRAHLGTAIHMCGTAPMGPVVDGDGRVHGVSGLRVADTSILPDTPHRGPFAAAVFIGEHLARRMRTR